MLKKSEINLNEAPTESNSNSMEQQQQQQENLDTDVIQSSSDAMVVNSNENNRLILTESSLPEENQAAAYRERRERILWTEEEHRLFLQGLNKYGKGRWKDISKKFVPGKTPTQIASHAQKYFKHQKEVAGKERKKRRSIHDITVDNNGTLISHPIIEPQIEIPFIEQQNESPHLITPSIEQLQIPSTEQQNKISPLVTHSNESPHLISLSIEPQLEITSTEQQKKISPLVTHPNESPHLISPSIEQQLEIPSTEQQNKISPLVTHPIEQQNEKISPHSTTLNDNNSDNLVTPSIEPFQEIQGLQLEYNYTFEITPHNIKNVVKVCDLLEKALKK